MTKGHREPEPEVNAESLAGALPPMSNLEAEALVELLAGPTGVDPDELRAAFRARWEQHRARARGEDR